METPANPVASVKTFLTSNPSREEILAYKFPDAIQRRLDYLLDLNAQDRLTIEQKVELDEIVNMDELITLIKAKLKSIPFIDLSSLGIDMTPRFPKTFHLMKKGELLAILEACHPHDEMFWLACEFKPTSAFAEVETLIREASDAEDVDIFEKNYDHLKSIGVILFDIENSLILEDFIIHIDGNVVSLRC